VSKHLKIWALEELLDKERYNETKKESEPYIRHRQRQKQKLKDAIDERGIPELHDPKANITLINHKYNPDRKLFPEKAWERREQQGFRKLNDVEKTFLLLEYLIPYSIPILLVAIIALLDI
jgi:hypothetical protein